MNEKELAREEQEGCSRAPGLALQVSALATQDTHTERLAVLNDLIPNTQKRLSDTEANIELFQAQAEEIRLEF